MQYITFLLHLELIIHGLVVIIHGIHQHAGLALQMTIKQDQTHREHRLKNFLSNILSNKKRKKYENKFIFILKFVKNT